MKAIRYDGPRKMSVAEKPKPKIDVLGRILLQPTRNPRAQAQTGLSYEAKP